MPTQGVEQNNAVEQMPQNNGLAIKAPEELTELMGWVQYFAKSKGHNFQDKYDLLMILRTCQDIGVPFTMGLTGMYIVNKRVRLHSEMPLAIVKKSGLLASHREYLIDESGEEIGLKNLKAPFYGAVCETVRKDAGGEVYQTYFTIDDAKRAGLWGKKDNWNKYPQRMLKARARMENLAYNFSDVLMGLSDYQDAGPAGGPRDVTPAEELKTADLDDITASMSK